MLFRNTDDISEPRRGFTIIELLVAISIVAILMSLILPGIFSARRQALAVECRSHLKQLALASHAYQSVFGVFPTRLRPLQRILPYVEQRSAALSNTNEVRHELPLFKCAAEAFPNVGRGQSNYLLNEGVGFQKFPFPQGYNGITKNPFRLEFTHPRDVTDGLSNTAMWSERKLPSLVLTAEEAGSDPTRYLWYIPMSLASPSLFDAFIQSCETQRTVALPVVEFTLRDYLQTDYGYNHVLTPNKPGCYNAATVTDVDSLDSEVHAVTATSFHSAHVNVSLADGSVRSVGNSVSAVVWHAIGTRNGNEVVSWE